MGAHAVAIKLNDATLALFLRVVRAPSGIYVVFAVGQDRLRHDPHSSWHRDGRVHHKSFGHEFTRTYKQALTAFAGADYFVTTSVRRDDAPHLPVCDPTRFDTVMQVPTAWLRSARVARERGVQESASCKSWKAFVHEEGATTSPSTGSAPSC